MTISLWIASVVLYLVVGIMCVVFQKCHDLNSFFIPIHYNEYPEYAWVFFLWPVSIVACIIWILIVNPISAVVELVGDLTDELAVDCKTWRSLRATARREKKVLSLVDSSYGNIKGEDQE